MLRTTLFAKIQSFSLARIEQLSAASLITRMTNDVTQVQNMLFMSLRIALRAPLLVVFGVAMAFVVHSRLALILAVAVPLSAAFLLWVMKKAVSSFSAVQRALDRVNGVMRENLAGMRLIKAWMRGGYEQERFTAANDALMRQTMSVLRLVETIAPVLLFVMNAAIVAILFLDASILRAGRPAPGKSLPLSIMRRGRRRRYRCLRSLRWRCRGRAPRPPALPNCLMRRQNKPKRARRMG